MDYIDQIKGMTSDRGSDSRNWQANLSKAMTTNAGGSSGSIIKSSQPVRASKPFEKVGVTGNEEPSGIEEYGELNPHPMEGIKTGLMNTPGYEMDTKDYGAMLNNALIPTKAGLFQMYGEDSMGGELESKVNSALEWLPDVTAKLHGGGKLGKTMSNMVFGRFFG